MSAISNILRNYVDSTKKLGPEAEKVEMKPERVSQLTVQLDALQKRNRFIFWICVIMILVVFVLSLLVTLKFLEQPETLKLIFGATGVSIMGLIYYMNSLYKSVVSVEMLIALVSQMDSQGINTVLAVLLKKLE